MLPYPSLVSRERFKMADRARTATSTMRCQGNITFANTRARAGHRASPHAFCRRRAFPAIAASSTREFFPIECVCRSKSIFLISGSRVGLYSPGTRILLLFRCLRGGDAAPHSRSGIPLQPEHAQEGSILEDAEEPPKPADAQGAKCPSPPTVVEQPYDGCPEGDRE